MFMPWVWLYLRSVLVGSLLAFMSIFVYAIGFFVSGPKNTAIGIGLWHSHVLHSPLFWLIVCTAFWIGTYLTMKYTAPYL